MADVKVSILEKDGVELDGPEEYILLAEDIPFSEPGFIATRVDDAIQESLTTAVETPIYTIVLQHNGTVSNGTFLGYDSLIPGDSTPVLVPKDADFTGFTFSNSNSGADYTLRFRKNSTTATVFYSVSKVNTQFFQQNLTTAEFFSAGDAIFIEYIDDGTNASDAVIVLSFRAVI